MSEINLATLEMISHSEQETLAIAAALAGQCKHDDCILLNGDLGAGKTTFARGFIYALCGESEAVVSPTFTIVQTYSGKGHSLSHFDLYRLKSEHELQEIGLEEALAHGVCLIEWPRLAQERLPDSALDIHIAHDVGSMRPIIFSGKDSIWQSRFDAIAHIMARA